MTFNKKTEILEQNINIFPFLLIMTSYIDEFSTIQLHDTPNLIAMDGKHINICLYQVS